MACLFGHRWQTGKCKKCGTTFGSVAKGYFDAKNGKKLAELLATVAKDDLYSITSTWTSLAVLFYFQNKQDWQVDSLKVLYEYADKNAYAYLLGRTGSHKAAEFLKEKLTNVRLGNFIKGHGVAMHDLKYAPAYDVVRAQCLSYSVDLAAPFYYALGAYQKQTDIDIIATFIANFVANGKHSWGFSNSLMFAVAGMVDIGSERAFDALAKIEAQTRYDPQNIKREHRAVILYGMMLISRGNLALSENLIDVLMVDVGNHIYNSYHQYILAKVQGLQSRVIQCALERLQALMEEECDRYHGIDCEAIYCLYALGMNDWNEYESIRPRFEAWLTEDDQYMTPCVNKFFASNKDQEAQDGLLSNSSLQTFIHIESHIHDIGVAFLPMTNQTLGTTIFPR